MGYLSDLAWLSKVLLFLPLWATAFLRDTWKSDYWVLRPLQLLCSGLSVEHRLIAGPTQTSINDEKIRQGKNTGMMFSELPRLPWPQKPGTLRTGSTDDLGHNSPIRDLLMTYHPSSPLTLERERLVCGPRWLPSCFVLLSTSPVSHSPGSQLSHLQSTVTLITPVK